MDSLTQIALGASIGAIIGGKKYGRKAALIGAICGTIPDLDALLLINADPVEKFTSHRGFSHSILFSVLATPIIAGTFSKISWFKASFKDKYLHWIVFLGLLTHILLDALTIYGTQLFWPLKIPPVGTGSIFIIDPVYTIPMLIALALFLFNLKTKFVKIALIFSSLYLLWGYDVQQYIYSFVPKEPNQKILVQTTPFNTFLWRVLIIEDDYYKVGYYSIFDKDKNIKYKNYLTQGGLPESALNIQAVSRLEWFTKGFYSVNLVNKKLVITDLRMGFEPDNYIFSYIVAYKDKSGFKEVPVQQYSKNRDMGQLSKIFERIWNQDTNL